MMVAPLSKIFLNCVAISTKFNNFFSFLKSSYLFCEAVPETWVREALHPKGPPPSSNTKAFSD